MRKLFPSRLRTLAVAMATLAAVALPGGAQADNGYPNKPIKMVVPYAAGGFTDVVARMLGQYMTEQLKTPVLIENKVGASSNIATAFVAKAAPDGYTILFTTGAFPVNPHLFKNLSFDPFKDFTPISRVGDFPYLLSTHADAPFNSFSEMLSYAKAHPEKVSFGTPGNGSPPHLMIQQLEQKANVKILSAHYSGNGPSLLALLKKEIDLQIDGINLPIPFIKEGKLKPLAVGSLKRSATLPNVPTMAETFPGFEAITWFQVVAPAQTPRPAIDRLNQVIVQFTKDEKVKKDLESRGAVPVSSTPEELDAYNRSEHQKWGKVIKDANIKID